MSEERIEHPTVHLAAPLGFNEFFNKNMRDLCDFDFDCLFHHVKELTSETMHKFDVLIMKGTLTPEFKSFHVHTTLHAFSN